MWIPVHRDGHLNERHYGALQGLNKAEIRGTILCLSPGLGRRMSRH